MIATSLAFMALPLVGTAAAQGDPAEHLCPIFIPEFPAQWCITMTGNGCVVIQVSTTGEFVFVNTCPGPVEP